ncbi:MAG: exopolysaccharide Pel transporter PelG [Acetatifactor sp.]|nr:exopolysaccharide Pel transporter PelG [Acetatifactor sp.]
MAGIGVKLNRIFSKNTIATDLVGFGYSTVITIAPMLLVIAALVVEELTLGFSGVGFYRRELFSCTILYIFIFGLLTASPFNPVLSKYMSDVIYNETYEDILPCYYVGLLMNISFSLLLGVPFCLREFFVGKVPMYYVFTGFCGYISLVLVFYSMLYLSICKDYKKISLYFTFGMVLAVLLSFVFVYLFRMEVTYSMLLSLVIGFFLIACLELSLVTSYFRKNSGKYKQVLQYFKKYWKLVGTNFLYILGLYIHNFVFWTTDGRMIVAKSFVCMQPYDMATCLAMFTNISASVIFITRVEMYFHDRYKAYSEAVIGGRGMDIDNAKSRMFRQLNSELMNLVRIQFVVTVVIFMLCITFLPNLGFGGMTMKIYPCLAAGYFVLFVMYAQIIFLYYFSDTTGSLLTAVVFCLGTLLGSIWATTLPIIWYGLGLVIGSLLGWTVAFFRIRYIERHLEGHIFCRERIMKAGEGEKPSNLVFDRYAAKESAERG